MSNPKHRYVAGFLFSTNCQRVVLIRKTHPEWQKGKLNGVGGRIEPGETPLECMRREFLEEAGIDVPYWTEFVHLLGHTPDGETFEVHFFRAEFNLVGVERVESKTEETVEIHLTGEVITQSSKLGTVSNIPWLVMMALPSSSHDWPFRIEERAKEQGIEWWRGVDDLARAVNATSDEFGEDMEASVGRMSELLTAVADRKPIEIWSNFSAPPEGDDDLGSILSPGADER